MITHESKPEQAARWLARYLADQPGRMADSAQVRAAAPAGLGDKPTLRRARERLGVQVHTGSLPGRPYVTYYLLPDHDRLILTESERAEAEGFLGVVSRGDQAQVHELLGSLRPARLALALAVLLRDERGTPTGATDEPATARQPPATSEVTGDPTGARGGADET